MAIRTHPPSGAGRNPARAATRLAGASFICLLGLVAPGRSNSSAAPLEARVLWAREDRVYIASTDSSRLGPGTRLTFVRGTKSIAAGEVTRILDGELVVARLTGGTLPREKDLKRVRIVLEPAMAPRSLRVGYPSAARITPFFACDSMSLARLPGSYRVEVSGPVHRIIQEPGSTAAVPWPDTLVVRQFDEAADEEIALERGELDVAVFWPGELSAHMRSQPRWQGRFASPKPRGLVAALWLGPPGADTTGLGAFDRPLMAALNRELFRGDLLDWRGPASAAEEPGGAPVAPTARYDVDPTSPGRAEIDRFLARTQSAPSASDHRPLVRLAYLDCSPYSPDSIAAAVADCQRRLAPTLRVLRADPVFLLECPVVFEPRLDPYLRMLGAWHLVELFDCTSARHRP